MTASLSRGRVVLLALSVASALAGCTSGTSDLHEWVDAEKHKKGEPIPPLPVLRTFETFAYQDQNARDPFSPSAAEADASTTSGTRPDENRPKEPLEMFSLDTLRMVGTIGTGNALEALVKDPGGVIHKVHRNEYMGQAYGRVTAVGEDHIDLVELVPNGTGGWMERPASISVGDK
ncbi:pilus assembly protein PilP [Luteibacter anthropi]|uniref:Pilus assembly protein PilP n=1 Tax=Luteibacter anthropi TaxID=564369 RepID=A0A7X5UD05_9GAMM|nr:pilus assembly protein PilP [Luteibacter anthropi]NII08235.1 pilus assembly protein PilP [Luteibacter anthropi]URX64317.1 pilus assembly protein PilP [Luteibacter anthropi]